jgi:hypothetical protein
MCFVTVMKCRRIVAFSTGLYARPNLARLPPYTLRCSRFISRKLRHTYRLFAPDPKVHGCPPSLQGLCPCVPAWFFPGTNRVGEAYTMLRGPLTQPSTCDVHCCFQPRSALCRLGLVWDQIKSLPRRPRSSFAHTGENNAKMSVWVLGYYIEV